MATTGITEADVIAHDYGTSVATELLARRRFGYEPINFSFSTAWGIFP